MWREPPRASATPLGEILRDRSSRKAARPSLVRRSAPARDLRLSAHRRAARPKGLDRRLVPRKRYAPAARGSSPLGDSSRREHWQHPGGLLKVSVGRVELISTLLSSWGI